MYSFPLGDIIPLNYSLESSYISVEVSFDGKYSYVQP